MQLFRGLASTRGVALSALFLITATAQTSYWEISCLETHSGGTRRGHNHNVTVSFTITSPNTNNHTTRCTTSFQPSTPNATYYPTLPHFCADDDFAFSFNTFTSIADFSLDLQQSYHDPRVGPLNEIFFGTSSTISPRSLPGYTCTYNHEYGGDGVRACWFEASEGEGGNGPLVIEITSAIAKRGKEKKKEK